MNLTAGSVTRWVTAIAPQPCVVSVAERCPRHAVSHGASDLEPLLEAAWDY